MFRYAIPSLSKCKRYSFLPQIGPFDIFIHRASCRMILDNLQKYLIDVFYLFHDFSSSTSGSPYVAFVNRGSMHDFFSSYPQCGWATSQKLTDILLSTMPQFSCF